MNESVQNILYDPVVGKIVTAVIGILIVIALVRLAQRSIGRYVKETQTRYRARKFTHFIGYLLMTFTLRYVVDFKKRRTIKDVLYWQIITAFDATQGKVTFASAAQEISLMSSPRLEVKVDQPG